MNSTERQPQYHLVIGAMTDVGRTRKHNEDYVGFVKPDDPQKLATYGSLLVVCDGVGGAAAGEIASETAVHRILTDYYDAPAKMTVQERLATAIQSANAAIYKLNEQRERQMATTVVAAVIIDKHLVVAHAGDSRAYLVRNGQISQITEDHSWVEEMVRAGDLTPAEAKVHPWRNRITRGLGMTPTVKVDVTIFDWQPDDILVLCSDGLTRHVQDAEIAQVVTHYPPENAAQRLIDMANQRGGKDNISAIVATTTTAEEPAPVLVPPIEDDDSREPTQVPALAQGATSAHKFNLNRNKRILLVGLLGMLLICLVGGLMARHRDKATPTPTIPNNAIALTQTAVASVGGQISTPTNEPANTPTLTVAPTSTSTPIVIPTLAPAPTSAVTTDEVDQPAHASPGITNTGVITETKPISPTTTITITPVLETPSPAPPVQDKEMAGTPVTVNQGTQPQYAVITEPKGAKLRESPEVTDNNIRRELVPEGQIVLMTGLSEDGKWYRVQTLDGLDGWIFRTLISQVPIIEEAVASFDLQQPPLRTGDIAFDKYSNLLLLLVPDSSPDTLTYAYFSNTFAGDMLSTFNSNSKKVTYQSAIQKVKFSFDGNILGVLSEDAKLVGGKTIHNHELVGSVDLCLSDEYPIKGFSFAPHGQRIACVDTEKIIFKSINEESRVESDNLSLSYDSELAVARRDKFNIIAVIDKNRTTFYLYQAGDNESHLRLLRNPTISRTGDDGKLSAIAVSVRAERLAIGTQNGRVGWVSLPDNVQDFGQLSLEQIARDEITALAFNDDGTRLAAGTATGHLFIWKEGNNRDLGLSGWRNVEGKVKSLAFSKDGQLLAVLTENKLHIYRIEGQQ